MQSQPSNCGGLASKSSTEAGTYPSGNTAGAPSPMKTQAYSLVPTRMDISENASSVKSAQSTELV